MKLPIQSQPVERYIAGDALHKMYSGIHPSCPSPDRTPPGTCFDANGQIPGRWNCSACCALRGALSWQGGGQAYPC
ncbi:MAG: hypothetical protein ACLFT9_06290 [Coleofasciculus sp.]